MNSELGDTAFVYHGKQYFRPMANSPTVEIRIISKLNWSIFKDFAMHSVQGL